METQIDKVVYIAHPISGDVEGNLKKILKIVRDINLLTDNILPFAPYVVDCYALDDTNAHERKRGIANDKHLIEAGFIDEVWLFGNKISIGMKNEIRLARFNGIPVVPKTYNTEKQLPQILESLYDES